MDQSRLSPFVRNSEASSFFSEELRFPPETLWKVWSVDENNLNLGEDEPFESTEEIEAQTIGNLLPDDDDLLSGVIDDLGFVARPNSGDDIDDDIFYSGGGMELEPDDNTNVSKGLEFVGGGASNGQQVGPNGTIAGEHPFAARNAMKALQNKPLRRRKLDIHFSIPKARKLSSSLAVLEVQDVLPLHHVGSAPQVNPSLWDRRHGYAGDFTDPHSFHPGSVGSMGFSDSPQLHPLELASRGIFPHATGNC
ncbi:hypothetical protein GW17_00041876, partial [Ensete ventricosum]